MCRTVKLPFLLVCSLPAQCLKSSYLKPAQSVSQLSPNNMNKKTADKSLSAVGMSVSQAWCEGFSSWLIVHVMKPWSDGQVSAGRAGSVNLTCSLHAPEATKGTKVGFSVLEYLSNMTLQRPWFWEWQETAMTWTITSILTEIPLSYIQIKSQLLAFSSCQLLKILVIFKWLKSARCKRGLTENIV